MSNVTRFPLAWPVSWKRTPIGRRKRAAFHATRQVTNAVANYSYRQKESLSIGDAVLRLSGELRRLGARDWLISSNLRIRTDGLPYASQANPDDAGVAVYFKLGGKDRVLACDTWTRVADNIAAVAGHIAAMRTIERYGVGTVEQAFAGYDALPAKGETWRTTLGFAPHDEPSRDAIDDAFRARARDAHPDIQGGSHDAMASLNMAREEAYEWLQQRGALHG